MCLAWVALSLDGIECEHRAFRSQDTDWELWVELGSAPIQGNTLSEQDLPSSPQ
ncbi:DUF2092 domain-containing protein [Rhizobium phaseoli]|uniref:DUF2092 domain-containing protein n=1 Tax=Rhizobium phaseoli TaxID=396 RepID=UPI0009B831EC|nr:DUF2092 domain-containing protein [Rhizobium phaseoli]PWI51205.1 hypothetical protein B5K03_26775 [Rhizobium phaseoli]